MPVLPGRPGVAVPGSAPIATDAEVAAAVAAHEADSTSVHGITDTAQLVTTTVANATYLRGVSVLAYGALGDGTTDDTAAIQAAVDAVAAGGGGTVWVPEGTYMVTATGTGGGNFLYDSGGIELKDNVHLRLDSGATIKAIANSATKYVVIRIYNKTNVSVTGGTIQGERSGHSGGTGEWGYGIAVTGGSNITLRDLTAKDCWGDGINLQRVVGGGTETPTNVLIENVICSNNRRQGMSVEAVRGLYVSGSTFTTTNGQNPGCGVDIEPNQLGQPVEDIVFYKCRFTNNAGSGMLAMGSALANLVLDSCVFDTNADSEAQLKTYTAAASRGVRVSRCVFRGSPQSSAIRIQGTQDVTVEACTLDKGVYVLAGPSSAAPSNITIWGNNCKSGATTPLYWVNLVSTATQVFIESNTFDSSTTYRSDAVGVVAAAARTWITDNYFLHVARPINVSNADIQIVGNRISNPGIYMMDINGASVDRVRIARNTFAGACHKNNNAAGITLTTHAGVIIEDNTFLYDPIESGADTGRVARVLSFTAAGSLFTRRNKVIGSFSGFFPSSFTAPTTGYVGGEDGLMSATTANRPSAPRAGMTMQDTTLNKPIWFDGTNWKDATGATV